MLIAMPSIGIPHRSKSNKLSLIASVAILIYFDYQFIVTIIYFLHSTIALRTANSFPALAGCWNQPASTGHDHRTLPKQRASIESIGHGLAI